MNSQRKQRIIAAIVIGTIFGTGIPAVVWAQRGDRDQDQRYEQNKDKDQKQDQRGDRRTQQPRTQQPRTQQPRTQQPRTQQPRTQQPRTQQPRTQQPRTQPRVTDRNRALEQERYTRSRTAPPPRGYVLDPKYRHNRYYPPRGYVTPRLPSAYRQLTYKNRRYYYHSGVWYRHSSSGFIVIFPPIGVAIPLLPPFYTTIWVGGVPYYYANGIYYVWYPRERVYVVTNPPPESAISEEPTAPQRLYIYPKRGQSEEQQAADRYQCHAWATDQTGFDPTREGGNVASDEYFNKRDDYHRAMKACLEARGYSVQ